MGQIFCLRDGYHRKGE
ncbi:hypothetical protein Q7P18_04975 [Shigella flexneri]|nr:MULTISPECIES: hypothetical protein [Shigella]MDO8228249.1 hypothetical protein [Shigella flexneri]